MQEGCHEIWETEVVISDKCGMEASLFGLIYVEILFGSQKIRKNVNNYQVVTLNNQSKFSQIVYSMYRINQNVENLQHTFTHFHCFFEKHSSLETY